MIDLLSKSLDVFSGGLLGREVQCQSKRVNETIIGVTRVVGCWLPAARVNASGHFKLSLLIILIRIRRYGMISRQETTIPLLLKS